MQMTHRMLVLAGILGASLILCAPVATASHGRVKAQRHRHRHRHPHRGVGHRRPGRHRHRAKVVRPADPLAQAPGIAFGVNLQDGPTTTALDAFTKLVGLAPRLVLTYEDWDQPLIWRQQIHAITEIGALPLLTWDPIRDGAGISLQKIAHGSYDRYIASAARSARRRRSVIYVRFAHEMNLKSSPFGPGHAGDTPRSFVAAWRHVVTIFRRQRAYNVRWVWSPNVNCAGGCPFHGFYPGTRWIDWMALDGYNYGPVDHTPWHSFADIFTGSYQALLRLSSKPIMIAETASTELGGNKAAWILSMGSVLKQLTHVRALVWFDRDKETDWRIDSSPAALAAFHTVVTSGLFSL